MSEMGGLRKHEKIKHALNSGRIISLHGDCGYCVEKEEVEEIEEKEE